MYPHGSSHQLPALTRSSSSSAFVVLVVNQLATTQSCILVSRTLRQSTNFPVPHVQKPSTISTGRLQTLLPFHLRPIQLVVFKRSYFLFEMGSLILRSVSHLDAFSGYQLRRLLLGYATGVTTDSQALRPPRSSRTRGSSPQTPYAHSG